MSELLIMRHAKSDWSNKVSDYERPLNERGRSDAHKMGLFLSGQELIPDRVLFSSAARAVETFELLSPTLGLRYYQCQEMDELYLADLQTLLAIIDEHFEADSRLMLIAHNPGLDELVEYLADRPPEYTRSGQLMVSGAIAHFIHVDGDFFKQGGSKMDSIWRPKAL